MAKLQDNGAGIWAKRVLVGILLIFTIPFWGCAGIGPKTVARDRFDYVSAISESWKRQTLLNLLKTRYLDAPVSITRQTYRVRHDGRLYNLKV